MKPEFEELHRKYAEGYAHWDAGAVAELYAPDGLDFLFNGEHARGREAVRKQIALRLELLKTAVGDAGIRLHTEPTTTREAGDLGYEIGGFVITTEDGTHVLEGDYTVVATKVAGQWKIASHMTTGLPQTQAEPGKPVSMV